MQVSEAREQYVRWLVVTRDLSQHTIRAYDGDISAFERHLESNADPSALEQDTFWDGLGAAGLIATPAFTPKFAAVLAGQCDAALYLPVRPHRTAIWDYAGVAQLLSEAGGRFGDTDGTEPLEALPFEYSAGWIAVSPSRRDQLLAVAQRFHDGAARAS